MLLTSYGPCFLIGLKAREETAAVPCLIRLPVRCGTWHQGAGQSPKQEEKEVRRLSVHGWEPIKSAQIGLHVHWLLIVMEMYLYLSIWAEKKISISKVWSTVSPETTLFDYIIYDFRSQLPCIQRGHEEGLQSPHSDPKKSKSVPLQDPIIKNI